MTPTEGILTLMDLVTKNLLEKFKSKVRIVSSISYMDTISTKALLMSSFLTLLTITVIPLGLSG